MNRTCAAGLALLLGTAVPVAAQTTTPAPTQTVPPTTTVPPAATVPPATTAPRTATPGTNMWYNAQANELRASQLIGTTVRNPAGENIGEVNEILLSPQGQVQAIVVGVGGFLGIGERNVAISPQGYQMTRDSSGNMVITVNATQDTLRQAPVWTNTTNRR